MQYGQLMIEALQDNNLEQAEAYFTQALKQDSDEQLYLLAETLYQLGFLEETRKINLQLLETYPEDDELRITLAEIAVEADDMDTALDWLLEVQEGSEAYPQALLVMADLYQVQGLHEVSEQKLKKAKEILPDEPIVTFASAELHYSMGKYAQAIREYEELMQSGFDQFSGVDLAGRCGSAYSAIGDLENALPYLEESAENTEQVDVLFELGFTYLQKKEFKRANETFHKLKELDPTYTSVYPYLARGLEEENALDKALEAIQEGLHYDQYNEDLFTYGAWIALKMENEDLAADYYTQALALAPENTAISLAYTNLLLKQEKYEEAVNIIQEALTDNEVDPQFYWNLAIANVGLEEYAAAATAYQKAYSHFRQNKDFLRSYIFFLREEGNRTTIKGVIEDYLLLEPADTEMVSMLEEINSNY